MGCSSSKPTEVGISSPRGTNVSTDAIVSREKRKKSVDSGISLAESSKHDAASLSTELVREQASRKGISFDITLQKGAISNCPPKRLSSYMESRQYRPKRSHDALHDTSNGLDAITQKQIRAAQLRDQERNSVVARQKRREARARRVHERRQKLQHELEISENEELSDFEVDANFNTSDDYDFTTTSDVNEQTNEFADVTATVEMDQSDVDSESLL